MRGKLGVIHRALRFIIGIILASVGAFAERSALWRAVFVVVGIVAITTAFTGVCPLFSVLGIGTRKDKKSGED